MRMWSFLRPCLILLGFDWAVDVFPIGLGIGPSHSVLIVSEPLDGLVCSMGQVWDRRGLVVLVLLDA